MRVFRQGEEKCDAVVERTTRGVEMAGRSGERGARLICEGMGGIHSVSLEKK